mgnify:CR=1 FL=1
MYWKMEIEDLKQVCRKQKIAIQKVLLYIEEVIDAENEKELCAIKEELEESALLSHSHIREEAKPPRENNCLWSEMSPWKRRIRLLADNMSRLNLNFINRLQHEIRNGKLFLKSA